MEKRGIWGTLDPFAEHSGVMGRSVANAGFLRALLRQDAFRSYHFFLPDAASAKAVQGFVEQVQPELLQQPDRLWLATRPELPRALHTYDYHCFHLSDCINYPAHLARLRNLHARKLFPVTSVTHSLSYARYHKEFLAHLWPGCTCRDAVVATSESARQMLQDTWAWLRRQYSLDDSFQAPSLPVIPLGLECQGLRPVRGEQRQALRRSRGINEADVVLLVFARLSHTAKLDALALLRALNRAAAPPLSMQTFTVILAGATDSREQSDYIDQLRGLAVNLGLKLLVEENPSEGAMLDLYSLSDIFVSPVDNYQETFGLTILEAGAMELPVVASDFDGYRHLVRHDETGILVPTVGPAESSFMDAASQLLLDNQYQLLCAQQVAVDVPALARALRRLALSPGLRTSMGHAARRHVCSQFPWEKVVWRYIDLWDAMWHRPLSAAERERLRGVEHPQHIPLASAFAGYPAATLDDASRLRWSRAGEAHYRGREGLVVYGGMQSFIRPEWIKHLVFLARKGATVAELRQGLAEQAGIAGELAAWCVLWALKHDLLELES